MRDTRPGATRTSGEWGAFGRKCTGAATTDAVSGSGRVRVARTLTRVAARAPSPSALRASTPEQVRGQALSREGRER